MERNAKQAGASLKRRSPGVQARASEDNVKTEQEMNVMSKSNTAAANVIPFDFGKKPVRALLIDDQPWFVATDVSAALEYRIAGDMTRNLDDDEKGTQIVRTLGGAQEMLVINESGLYSAILRSRKAEAKRFKKWVTAEVLPAIRKHGRYEDAGGKMGTLIDAAIGVTELTALNGVIRQKAAIVRQDRRRSFIHTMHSRLHTRFNVPRTELILAKDFEAACNFVAAYAIEGEFLPRLEESAIRLTESQAVMVHHLIHHAVWVAHYWNSGIGEGARSMQSPAYPGCNEHLGEIERYRRKLDADLLPSIRDWMAGKLGARFSWGLRPGQCAARGIMA